MLNRMVGLAGFPKSVAEVVVAVNVVRLNVQRMPICFNGLFDFSRAAEGNAQIVVILGDRGVQRYGTADKLHGLLVAALVVKDKSKQLQGIRLIGVLGEN